MSDAKYQQMVFQSVPITLLFGTWSNKSYANLEDSDSTVRMLLLVSMQARTVSKSMNSQYLDVTFVSVYLITCAKIQIGFILAGSRQSITSVRELSQITYVLRGGYVVRKTCSLLHKMCKIGTYVVKKCQKMQM